MRKNIYILAISLLALSTLIVNPARAELRVEVSGAGASQLPITVANFEGDEGGVLAKVVRADLMRSGLFKLVSLGDVILNEDTRLRYDVIRSQGMDAMAVGRVIALGDGSMEVRFRLHDVVKEQDLGGAIYSVGKGQLRQTAHRVADLIYEKLLGVKGDFSTRIAYVLKKGGRYELQVADSDGQNSAAALISREPIISPAWSPDGRSLAYVSFESKKPVVYVHDLRSGNRQVVANFKGSNSAPAWSPDGTRMAVVLTRDGGSQIFVMNRNGSGLRRLTSTGDINTEPRWSPDGAYIYFTSNRGGGPQIYRISVAGGTAERVTFDGDYNVSPGISPDSKAMAYIGRKASGFQLSTIDLSSRQILTLTETANDESPSYSPNGRLILYATRDSGHGVLAVVSVDGRVRQRLIAPGGSVRQPAWGPFVY